MSGTTLTSASNLTPETVPLRSGPPAREELLIHYPPKFTFHQLKTFINAGDLGLLKRDRKLQKRYDAWSAEIRKEYGSMVNYLLTYRLQWGKRDARSLLKSTLDVPDSLVAKDEVANAPTGELPPLPSNAPPYFKADTSPELISIIMNDWPYSVPNEVEHSLIWTRVPILPPDLPPSVEPRLLQDGLWGFTGSLAPPPSPDTLPECLGALSEWNLTMDKLVRSPEPSPEERMLLEKAGSEVDTFVKWLWREDEWETAWFVNPPRLQSVPGLAHIHVFARRKTHEEITEWKAAKGN
ncbi:uncharacterized protein B0H18DRAFT_325908 [Fomitopsis serialis]|uniref:uncharacterized protein n=1 Tax=Fomitopsis serialis TaxID=139415 RepID=UPI002007CFF3|nr:uncharacterized protein B0H18DRAFT_325908 [Neoantrodia serialis]KAH9936542.1 hypothetical protein B0H18DRAFT_325908 [Neoantrodia serialis]